MKASGQGSNYFKVYLNQHNLSFDRCDHCESIIIWLGDDLIYPKSSIAPPPNEDLPEDIKKDYIEAMNIVNDSPKGAAALLRLVIEKICIHVGASGKTINERIKSLVQDGLDPLIQKSLDAVRVIGNEAVHPGTIDLNDDKETAIILFALVNNIANKLITYPNSVEQVYNLIPESKLKGIEQRDKK